MLRETRAARILPSGEGSAPEPIGEGAGKVDAARCLHVETRMVEGTAEDRLSLNEGYPAAGARGLDRRGDAGSAGPDNGNTTPNRGLPSCTSHSDGP